ncbi:hypothetical protein H5410_047146 [Solanum commersonii]|uniref:Uncharacterized protein n=1 Tax=Solanum commersonii TaxID=4109 RepID=A0A9J5XIC3_SOLCO|nr:hypothetical protein H5410_047146 [Solanum commersonii]
MITRSVYANADGGDNEQDGGANDQDLGTNVQNVVQDEDANLGVNAQNVVQDEDANEQNGDEDGGVPMN